MSCSPLSVRVCACCASAQCVRVRLLCERAVCVCVRKWFKMVQNGTKWFKMCQNGQKWSKKAKNGKKTIDSFHITQEVNLLDALHFYSGAPR